LVAGEQRAARRLGRFVRGGRAGWR